MTTVKQDLFIINGSEADAEEWRSLSDTLIPDHESSINAYISDNELTHDEIFQLLDKNSNGRIEGDDLEKVNAGSFQSMEGILRKHGFRLSNEIQLDWNVMTESDTFDDVPGFLWSNKEFVLAAVRRNFDALGHADPALKMDPEVVLAAVKQCHEAIRYADGSLLQDKEFVLRAARENIGILQTRYLNSAKRVISEDAREYAWDRIREENAGRFQELFGDAELATFADFEKALKERYNIEWLSRFRSVDNMLGMLELRRDPSTANGRTAIMVSARADWKGSFTKFPTMDRLTELGFNVIYYEVEREDEVAAALNDATANGSRPADVVVLAGHGKSYGIELSETPQPRGTGTIKITAPLDETRALTSSDFENEDMLQLSRFVRRGGDLILNSCLNGEGGANDPGNFANTIKHTLPDARVQSSQVSMNISNITLDENGQPVFEWTEGNQAYTPQ